MTGSAVPAKADSERAWLSDLTTLRQQAPFADVAWSGDDQDKVVRAHKCIVYARATGVFQQRYLGVPHSISESDFSLYGHSSTSFRTFTPSSASHGYSLTPTPYDPSQTPRPSSSTERSASVETAVPALRPLSLGTTDVGVFEAALDYFYTGAKEAEAFAVVLDGFKDGQDEGDEAEDAVVKLREDFLYCWRSKLYADVSLVLDGADSTPFAAHRAILAVRSPYFRSLLLGNYADSSQSTFTLPSPPFTPASTTFVLGYLYSGTLDFSARKFDLSTSFEIWRCAAFLAVAPLQVEIEDKIVTSMLTLPRAARIFAFSHAPDVGNPRLAKAALPLVVKHFDEVWTSPAVGHLPYDVQKQLVRSLCATVKPETVADLARKVSSLRNKLEGDRAVWADHVRSMLEAVEEELVTCLAGGLSKTIASLGFVDLIDGVGFSTDVLEWLLTLVVKGLTESKAPESYQALVGSVLLREEGILADARVLVEDAKNGVLKYIKRKWINIRAAGGFDELENWCLKELADELEMSTDDLIADGPRLRTSPARSRQPPRRLLEGTPASLRKRPSEPASTPSPVPERRTLPKISTSAAPSPVPAAPIPARTPRLSTTSTASRASDNSAATGRTSTIRVAPDVRATSAARTAAGPARATPTRPAATAATTSSPRPPPASSSSAPRPPRSPAAANGTPPSSSTPRPTPPTSATARSTPPSSSSSPRLPPPVPSTSASSSSGSTPRSTPRRATSPAPSVAIRRSVTSTATVRTTAGMAKAGPSATPRAAISAATNTPSARPTAARTFTPGSTAAAARIRKVSSASSVKSAASSSAPSLRRPPSSSSLASTKRPASVTSVRRAAPAAAKTAPPPPPLPSSSSKRSLKTSTSSVKGGAPPVPVPKARAPLLPTSASKSKLSASLPGTSLLAGIPCIVTVRVPSQPSSTSSSSGGAEGKKTVMRTMRIKAMVRYIGKLVGEEGQWVGVEALESVIPKEAEGVGWRGDGEKNGITYFKLTQPSPPPTAAAAPSSGETSDSSTPKPSAPAAAGNVSSSGASSLRPPSRRAAGRRSSSQEPGGGGPRKGLFVRPEQILYVM